MNCPRCNEPKAHRSHRIGLMDWVMGFFSRNPYRCKSCKQRFYVYRHGETSSRLRTPEEQKILRIRRKYKWKQSKRYFLVYALVSVVLVAILYYMMQQRIGADG
jgi:hypothetical protein